MNIQKIIINDCDELDKLRFMQFIYKNTDSFIMNTFGHVWSGRNWWKKYPIELCVNEKNEVLGLHAYTVNDKIKDALKTYYIVVNKKFRGKGIAKILIKNAIYEHKDKIKNYYVNSDIKSDGFMFYLNWFGNNFKMESNDFNSKDAVFLEPIYNIIDEEA